MEVLNLNNNLLKKGIAIKANALHTNKTPLETLAISSNQIPEEAAESFAATIRSNCLLEVLNLYNNNLHDDGMIKIAHSLANLSSVKYLYVGGNKLSCKAADAIASVILANNKLGTLYLNENFLGAGVQVIANALKQIASLESVYLNNNQIPEFVAEDLAGALLINKSLRVVALSDNHLTTKGIKIISQAVSNLSELQMYNISYNYCTDEASDSISSVILHKTNVTVYTTGNCLQTGVIKIGNVLNSILIKELNLRYCNLSESVAASLAHRPHTISKYLEIFAFEGNNLGINGNIKVAKLLSSLRKLTLLNLDDTCLTKEAADAIAMAISSNPELEQIYLGNNKLHTGGYKIVRALKSLTNLRILVLNGSGICLIN